MRRIPTAAIGPQTRLVFKFDYYFLVHGDAQTTVVRLTPEQIVADGKSDENLVIVTSTGGGILAAGWTTLAMQKMIEERAELAHEIRMISGASGGSVGTAFYVNELLQNDLTQGACTPSAELLQAAFDKSVTSSLATAAYGLSFIDFWSIIFAWRKQIEGYCWRKSGLISLPTIPRKRSH